MVGLQALALYSTLVFSIKGSSRVEVHTHSGHLAFDVNQHNKLVYQEVPLKDLGGEMSVEVEGSMCASVQVLDHGRRTQSL